MALKADAGPDIPYRADVDGLRAIAVLAVLGFHANLKSLSGGFVGVDIFFVISGYLISSLILSRLKAGSFSFVDFYLRRCRRLFPALIAVLLTVWAIGWFAMWPTELAALGKHMIAAAAFAANILLYSEVGYFDVPAASKPLLHLWSLGVEEQFYIVFPALLLFVWRLRMARWLLIAIGLASFALNIAVVRSNPSFAFYMPMTRFWEFIAGTLVAYPATAEPASAASRPLLKPDLSAGLGILLVVAAIALIPSDSHFPGWWGVLPTAGAMLVIAAGPETWLNRKVLANPKVVYVGLISYPLYLWHWPLIVVGNSLAQYYSPSNAYPRTIAFSAIALSFLLAILTYEFIERPVRARKPLPAMRRAAGASAVCLAAVAVLGAATTRGAGFPGRYPAEVQSLLFPIELGADYPPPNEARNTAGPLVVTFGDSHSFHLQPGLRDLQNQRTFRLAHMGWGDCSPMGVVKPVDPESCRKLAADNEQEFARLKPDIVLISAFWWQYPHLDGIAETVRLLQRIGIGKIVVMGSAPFWPQPPQVLLYKAYRSDPRHQVPDRLTGFNRGTRDVDRRLQKIASDLGVTFVSLYDVLCNDSGCLARLGDGAKDIVQPDLTHFSAEGSSYVISHVADRILN